MKKLFIIIALLAPLFTLAQGTRQIKGQILDRADGTPLAGATVFIDPNQTTAKDYNPQGTIADHNGNFVFTLPSNVKMVVVSFLGYEALKVDITGLKDVNVRLTAQANQMDAVVVTGYQKIEKRKLTSSIATIDMSDINRVGVASVDQMLEGQLAGVMTTPTSGGPGSPMKMQVRSAVTLNGSQDPLWVLDGMPLEGNEIPKGWDQKESIDNLYNMSIAGMNPDDIQDITVLKDAAATAIYGARAANGVIIITSKKGKKGQSMRVNASLATFITAKPKFDKLNLMDANQKVDFELGLASNPHHNFLVGMGGVGRLMDNAGEREAYLSGGFKALSSQTQNAINKLRTNGTNWADEIYRMTVNQQYSLNVSGGGEKTAYYFSAGYYNEQGTTKGTGFDRFNLTLKTDFDLLKNLRFSVAMFGTATTNDSYITDRDAFSTPSRYARSVNPYVSAYDAQGNYIYDPDMMAQQGNNDRVLEFNYMEEYKNANQQMKNHSFKSIFELEYTPIKDLRLFTQFGLQLEKVATEKTADKNSYYVRKYSLESEVGKVEYLPDGGIIQNWNQDLLQYNWKVQAEYAKRIGKHEIDLMGGLEMRANTSKNIHTKGFGFDPKTLTTKPINFPNDKVGSDLAASSRFTPYQHIFNENRFMSYFMTGSYTYDNRYTVFGSLRYDGSNLFGVDPEFKFTPLWSISGAWNINREEFLRDKQWLSNLKLRLSYGVQGNIDRSTSPFVIGAWSTSNVSGSLYEPSISVSSPPNRYLRWETTDTWNAGLDFGVLDNRLSMTFEAYKRISNDLITTRFIPQENGFSSTMSNYGKMTSDGLEFSISSVNISTKSFRWQTTINLAHNKTIVNRINIDDNSILPSIEGYSPNAIFGFKTAGLDQNGVPMFWQGNEKVTIDKFFGASAELIPGMWGEPDMYHINFDQSSENIRSKFEYLGNGDPALIGGMTNKFSYKGFDLSVSANFVINQMVQYSPFYHPLRTNPGLNYTNQMKDIWSPSNPGGTYPAIASSPKYYLSSEPTSLDYMSTIFEGTGSQNYFNYMDTWTKKMSYLRINSIRLGYSLPSSLLKKIHIAAARFSFEVRNPFVIATNYDGYFDPETYGNIYAQPLPRTFSIGLNLSF